MAPRAADDSNPRRHGRRRSSRHSSSAWRSRSDATAVSSMSKSWAASAHHRSGWRSSQRWASRRPSSISALDVLLVEEQERQQLAARRRAAAAEQPRHERVVGPQPALQAGVAAVEDVVGESPPARRGARARPRRRRCAGRACARARRGRRRPRRAAGAVRVDHERVDGGQPVQVVDDLVDEQAVDDVGRDVGQPRRPRRARSAPRPGPGTAGSR